VKVFEDWGALSSGFLDTYVIPAVIEHHRADRPDHGGRGPFNPDVPDPQNQLPSSSGSCCTSAS